ncbi:hypothetical protein B0H11DRAFT_2206066 [Mycena galericulata]|nr:hypothetical protein B0H11DRAFT_2206066 [Mycena galericulata]
MFVGLLFLHPFLSSSGYADVFPLLRWVLPSEDWDGVYRDVAVAAIGNHMYYHPVRHRAVQVPKNQSGASQRRARSMPVHLVSHQDRKRFSTSNEKAFAGTFRVGFRDARVYGEHTKSPACEENLSQNLSSRAKVLLAGFASSSRSTIRVYASPEHSNSPAGQEVVDMAGNRNFDGLKERQGKADVTN